MDLPYLNQYLFSKIENSKSTYLDYKLDSKKNYDDDRKYYSGSAKNGS